MPPRIKLLIADLGLRYRPTAATDLEAHGSALALLAIDVADLPPDRLERAINTWVRAERWMPRASDLVALCQQDQRRSFEASYHPAADHAGAEAFTSARNAGPMAGRERDDIEWFVDASGEAKFRYKLTADQMLWKRDRIGPQDVGRCNFGLKRNGSSFRFTPDGFPYGFAEGDVDPAPATFPWREE